MEIHDCVPFMPGSLPEELAPRLSQRIADYQQEHDANLRRRHSDLLTKHIAGDRLGEHDYTELVQICDYLAGDH